MGFKVLIIAVFLMSIAGSGHAFARGHVNLDGLSQSGLTITIRKSKSIRLQAPKPVPATLVTTPAIG